MGEQERAEVVRLYASDEDFKAALMQAASVEEAVAAARRFGIEATSSDFSTSKGPELSDADLEQVGGGVLDQIWPTTPWVAC